VEGFEDTVGYSAIAFVSLGIIFLAIERTPVRWILSLWLPRKLGTYAYGIYIYHLLVIFPYNAWRRWRHFRGAWLVLDIAIYSGVICAAIISYHFYEAPFLRLKRHFVR